jgi:hypothetical protein
MCCLQYIPYLFPCNSYFQHIKPFTCSCYTYSPSLYILVIKQPNALIETKQNKTKQNKTKHLSQNTFPVGYVAVGTWHQCVLWYILHCNLCNAFCWLKYGIHVFSCQNVDRAVLPGRRCRSILNRNVHKWAYCEELWVTETFCQIIILLSGGRYFKTQYIFS